MELTLSFRATREIHPTLLGGCRLPHRTKVCQKLAGRDYKDTDQANKVGKVPEPVPLIYDAFARNGATHQSVSPKKPPVINDYGKLKTITETIALHLAQESYTASSMRSGRRDGKLSCIPMLVLDGIPIALGGIVNTSFYDQRRDGLDWY